MSSKFWALSAAKKKTELVPGTSKWVANELSTINDVVLDHNDKIYQALQDSYGHMNSFMDSVLQGIEDKQFVKELMAENSILLNQTSPSNFTYIAPDLPSSVKASPIISSVTSKESKIPHLQPLKPTSPHFILVEPSGPDLPPISRESETQNIQTKDSILHQTESKDSKYPSIKSESPQEQPKEANSPLTQSKKTNSPKLAKPARPLYTNVPSPVSSPVQIRRADSLTKKTGTNVFIPKTPSPLKEANLRVDTSKGEAEEEELQEADDSFQAISTAIRKSIAGKIALGTSEASNTPSSPPREIHSKQRERSSTDISNRLSMKEKLTRKSFLSKAPKRSSIFISLPSKEPIPVSSSSISNNGIRSRSLRVFERLDIASRHETSKNNKNSNFSLSPVALPKDSLNMKLSKPEHPNVKLSKPEHPNGQNLLHQPKIYKTHTQPQDRRIDAVKKATEESKESSKNNGTSHNGVNKTKAEFTKKSHTPNLLQSSNIPTLVKDEDAIQFHDYNSLKESKSPTRVNQRGSRSTTTRISPVRSKPPISRNSTARSPAGSSARTSLLSAGRSRSTSPERVDMNSRPLSTSPRVNMNSKPLSISPKRAANSRSPTLHQSVLRLTSRTASPDSRGSGNDLELISRLMAPTSSSSAKSKSSYRVQKPSKELKKPESTNTKNRFLTTTLIPTIPKFNPQKPPQFNHVPSKHIKAHHSPIKRRAPAMDEAESKNSLESKPGNTLESLQIPSLKKKSMMAERSEAAAQKPKQKIMLAMNHKLELKLNHPKPDVRRQKTEGATLSPKMKLLTGQQLDSFSTRYNIGNSIPLPEAARGNLRLNDANKRHDSKDVSPTKPKMGKSKILRKKASRISGIERRTTTDPHTPGKQYTPETLPDIHTDDEDSGSGKNEKILQSWGHTPELHRIIMQNKSINPTSVFGEVPKLNIEDIFESQSSRQRGKQSPQIPLDKKQLQREESQYAIEMGYK